MSVFKFLTFLLALALIATACGGEETPTPTTVPTAAPVEEPTAAPTAEPIEEPTPEPEPTAASIAVEREHVVDPALIDVTWQWESRTSNGGAEELISVPDPEDYTLFFNADGTFNAQLDCNSGSGDYATDGNGGIFMELGPTTRAACGPESLESEMINMFGPAQNYSFEEDGAVVIFKWVAGGPWDYYRKAGTSAAAESNLVGITWQWEAFQDTAGQNDITVPDPINYTLTLQPDGTAAIQADCNRVGWTYTLEGSSLTFDTVGPTTLAFCGEESLDQQYLTLLGETALYVVEEGQLFLNLKLDAGTMIFGQAGGLAISPEQISLDTQGLPVSWQAVVVPATPYDQSQPPGPTGMPEHIEILFGITDPAERQPSDPVMTIIPVDAYRQLWDDADNPGVTETMAQIERYSFSLPSPALTSGYPALPFEQFVGVNDLAVQVGRAVPQDVVNESSATQTGYRLVGRWAQDANPVTNQGLGYVYQGFTNDGEYLVSFWYPVTTDELPADVGAVAADQMEAFNADPQASIASAAEALNALSSDQWQPDLTTLDALVASLQIENMPIAGIQETTWEWIEGPVQPGSDEVVSVENPEKYQVVYGADGMINFMADCNSGGMSYTLTRSGMAGGMLAQPAAMTLAECEPGSLYQGFVDSLMAAQDYQVRAGGDFLELVLPAGGGVLTLADASATQALGLTSGIPDATEISINEDLPDDFIQLDVEGLAKTFEWRVVAASPIASGPGGQGFPRHIVLGFDGQNPLEVPYSERRIMYVFPVEAYTKLYNASDNDIVAAQVARLAELIAEADSRQGEPQGVMPLLPPPRNQMDRWVQFSDLNFAQGQGVRYISDSPFRQSIGVWANDTMDYYYQGLTEDGRFYVSLKWPVSTESLPNTAGEASSEVQEQATNAESYEQYEAELMTSLNALEAADWLPDLSELDAMIASLVFKG